MTAVIVVYAAQYQSKQWLSCTDAGTGGRVFWHAVHDVSAHTVHLFNDNNELQLALKTFLLC